MAIHAFPKSVRLRRPQEFRRTFDHASKTVCPEMVVFLATMPETVGKGPRLGVVVSKKVGGSVVRSGVKRRLREAFRQIRPELARDPEFARKDLVIVARPGTVGVAPAELAVALRRCLGRLRS